MSSKEPYGPASKVPYADPGYQADKKKRFPIDTEKHIRAAWSYINQKKNAAQYTPKQLARIKAKIKAAMKKIGADVSDEKESTRWGELREYYPDGPEGQAGFCVDAYNGPISLTMRACMIDPANLRLIAAAAMTAACDALQAMDPDMDADIDVPGASEAGQVTPDDDMGTGAPTESATITVPGTVLTETDLLEAIKRDMATHSMTINEAREKQGLPPLVLSGPPTGTGTDGSATAHTITTTSTNQPVGGSTNTEKEPAVSEPTQQAAETTAAPARTLTDADVSAIGETIGAAFAAALKANTPAPAPAAVAPAPVTAPATETAPPATEAASKVDAGQALKETAAAAITEATAGLRTELTTSVQETEARILTAVREELQRLGVRPSRQGFRVHENDQQDPTPAAAFEDRANILLGDFAKTPVPHAGTGIAPAPTGPAAATG